MKKYAVDLTSNDKILDKHTGETVIIDWIEELDKDQLRVYGYTETHGDDWTRTLTADSIVRIA